MASATVRSGSRLHFGLLESSPGQPLCFGGLGMMITQPLVQVTARGEPVFDIAQVAVRIGLDNSDVIFDLELVQEIQHRCHAVLQRLADQLQHFPALLQIEKLPPLHCGLGVGTQLACAIVAAALQYDFAFGDNKPKINCDIIERLSGRGLRSSIGLQGFANGGLIVDAGKNSSQTNGYQTQRHDFPASWRILLATPNGIDAIAGEAENEYMHAIGRHPNPARDNMWGLIQNDIIPAMQSSLFDRFSSALFEYGRLAGQPFKQYQGGTFRSEVIAELVKWFRGNGVSGVGQSSWGPTVFAVVATESEANELRNMLAAEQRFSLRMLTVSESRNRGYDLI